MRDKDARTFPGASLLLAEDEPLNADIAKRTLGKLGCRVAVAPDGLAAVRMWQEGRFALVLMDCEMPGMDGFEAARKIRLLEAASGGTRTPIVALTAHAPQEIKERCLAVGMDDVLAKPFKEMLLKDMLSAWIDGEGGPAEPNADWAPTPIKGSAAIDRDVLRGVSAFQGSAGRLLLKSVVARFAETAGNQVALLRESHGGGQLEEVRRIAHTLKSSSATLGATSVSECCREIELRAGRGEGALLPRLVAALESELSRAVVALGEIARERRAPDRVAG